MKLETFAEVQQAIRKNEERKFSLLLGNGFSMAYDPGIFSYTALHEFVEQTGNVVLDDLFRVVETNDFEQVMRQLELLASLVTVLGLDASAGKKIEGAIDELRRGLVDAIRGLHPEHVFKVPQAKIDACTSFLAPFLDREGEIFTVNYDLLLYWVLMRGGLRPGDGFGRDRESIDEYVPEDELEYSELRWGRSSSEQRVHYLHGALHLFDTGTEIVKEEYNGETHLLRRIAARVDGGEYPVFVTAGESMKKFVHIRHNSYLQHCYETLAATSGSLVTFGFNFGPQDAHIVGAINRASERRRGADRLWSIYVGVYSDEDRGRIESLAPGMRCKVHIFDSKTARVW